MTAHPDTPGAPPAISIVLPVYNGESFLPVAIESCQAQTLKSWELIVVDDASTDRTAAIIRTYAAGDERIRCIRHQENRMLAASLNTGFGSAQGIYLTWTSDDNWYEPTALQEMKQALDLHPGAGLVYAGMHIEREPHGRQDRSRLLSAERLPLQNVVGACFLYRRTILDSVGMYDPLLPGAEDYDYWLRARRQAAFKPLRRWLYHYRLHEHSLTSTRRDTVLRSSLTALERNFGASCAAPARALAALHAARLADQLGDPAAARRHLDHCKTLSQWVYLRHAVLGPFIHRMRKLR
ncbi:MAG: hypothetical protein A2498_03550 [Lentisphaerae bacterium RIFOXYC12_FULL_60_16]|nr:MAG: hypothetical protein A2498_03550 [Lentisphaerae bacterium RIFOXYC12_FULL_60_16]OGV83916.1 MAG: hypothetical protein A2340_11680 [Lentisphaerae bacterium RIFOXYB12_FULL_60_10]